MLDTLVLSKADCEGVCCAVGVCNDRDWGVAGVIEVGGLKDLFVVELRLGVCITTIA